MNDKISWVLSRISRNRLNSIIVLIIMGLSIYGCKSNDKTAAVVSNNSSFDSLKTVHDTVVAQYNSAQVQVDQLITKTATLDSEVSQKDAAIAKLENEIKHAGNKNKTLSRKLRKDNAFIKSIKNELTEKEKSFADQLGMLQTDKATLTQKLSDLLTRFNNLKELGSVLHASNIRIEPLHIKHNGKKERKTVKARKSDILRIHFDIDENRIAENGNKKIYLVITGPDGKLLSNTENNSGSITINNGQAINYSIYKEIPLRQNEPVKDVTIDWKQGGEHSKGIYNLSIYNGGYKIGAGNVALR